MKNYRFQHDDFITDSVYSADGHIGFEGYKLKNYSVMIQNKTNYIYLLAILMFERRKRRSELNLIEKIVDEAQKLFLEYELERKVFQFNDLVMYVNLHFSKPDNQSLIAPISMQKSMRKQMDQRAQRNPSLNKQYSAD